jgi:hypothetical protein
VADFRRKEKAEEHWLVLEKNIDDYIKGETISKTKAPFMKNILNGTYKQLIHDYEKRIQLLIHECERIGVDPVFITQPLLLGNAVDSVSGRNFGDLQLTAGLSGLQYWNILQEYNASTIKVATQNKKYVINLADSLPKSRAYFYDILHFTKAGSKRVSEILSRNLSVYINEKYPTYRRKGI